MLKTITAIFIIFFSSIIALEYTVELTGVKEKSVVESIKKNSALFKLKDNPPENVTALQLRANRDMGIIKKIMNSYGYYNAKVEYRYTSENGHRITIEVLTEQIFNITKIESNIPIEYQKREGLPASVKNIINSDQFFIKELQGQGYPLAEIIDKKITANREHHSVTIKYDLLTGPIGYFDSIVFNGLEKIKLEKIMEQISWKKGDTFHPDLIAETIYNLEDLRLFNMVDIDYCFDEDNSNDLNVTINLIETPPRHIGIGLGYSSYYNIGTNLSWGDYNFRQRAERVSLDLDLNQKRQKGNLSYLIPHFKHANQNLILEASLDKESLDAYKANIWKLQSSIERSINNDIDIAFGIQLENIRTDESDDDDPFLLIGAIYRLQYNRYDSQLDPRRGYYFEYNIFPFMNTLDVRESFVKQTSSFSYCLPLNNNKTTVVGWSLQAGNIMGNARQNIPAPLRFYEGTSQGLRGYKYKTVSPLDSNNKPTGGRSKLLANLELRQMVSKNISTVLFLDAGNVFEESTPRLDQKILKSWGLGMRYHSPMGPVRFDLAYPLDRRSIDNSYQIYVSIGQTF